AVVAPPALRHPGAIMPDMARRASDNRRSTRRPFGALRLRVRLERQKPVFGSEDLVFVVMTGPQPGHEELPKPAALATPHRHSPPIPGVEVADDADPARIGRPQRKGYPFDSLVDEHMGAELLVAREMIAFDEEMNVELAENRRKTVDIVEFVLDAAARCAQPIAERLPPVGEGGNEEAVSMDPDALGGNLPRG